MAAGVEAQGPSLEEVLSQHGLVEKDLDRECSPNIMYEIAIKIEDWKTIGHYFGIPQAKLVAIEVDNRTEESRRVTLLNTWSQQEGKSATYLKLMKALHHQRRNDLVDSLCGMIKSSTMDILAPTENQEQSSGSGL